MKHALHMGAAALAISFAGAVFAADNSTMPAAPPAPVANSPFATLDANKDGRLSQSEIRTNSDLNSRFATLDADGDTYLSQLEYGKWEGSQRQVPGPADRVTSPEAVKPPSPAK